MRVNQSFFRKTVLLSYENKCCITGISIPALLVASHTKPWANDLLQAANPENGLCLNALHDKAFDKGLITISNDFKIQISEKLLKSRNDEVIKKYFMPYHQMEIVKPNRFMPRLEFLNFTEINSLPDLITQTA